MADAKQKVAVVGYQKTGTTSLKLALEALGYRVASPDWPTIRAARDGDLEYLRHVAEGVDAVQDIPWFLFVRELDEWFPHTKFILTVRDEDAWMASWRAHFDRASVEVSRRLVFGDCPPPSVDEGPYLDRYRRHNSAVRDRFRERPDQYLEMALGEGGEWDRLCRFLGVDPPTRIGRSGLPAFPAANRRAVRERRRGVRVRALARMKQMSERTLGRRTTERLGQFRRRLLVRLR